PATSARSSLPAPTANTPSRTCLRPARRLQSPPACNVFPVFLLNFQGDVPDEDAGGCRAPDHPSGGSRDHSILRKSYDVPGAGEPVRRFATVHRGWSAPPEEQPRGFRRPLNLPSLQPTTAAGAEFP